MLNGRILSNTAIVMLAISPAVMTSFDVRAQSEEKSGFYLEEINVVARKREENLQDAPVAISAYTANELKRRHITKTDDLDAITPNLTFDGGAASSGTSSSAMIFMRGIGQLDYSAVTDPGVGLYIDGVYIARSLGSVMDFLDLERVEILRGPQGTLFGRNTIGGAITLYTQKPDDELDGYVELETGTGDALNFSASMDIPVLPDLLTKLSFASRDRDGYVERVNGGSKRGEDNSVNARLAALWTPSDTIEVHLTADYTREKENGSPEVSLGVNDQQTFAHLANAIDIPGCFITPPPSPPGAGRDTGNDPDCLNDTAFIGKHKSGETLDTISNLEMWGVATTVTWDVGEDVTLKSISAYRELDTNSVSSGDQTEHLLFHREEIFNQHQFSQELQAIGTLFHNRVDWVLGAYYFEEKASSINPVYFPSAIGDFISGGDTDNNNFASFSQVSWHVTDRLHLTGGVRYTKEHKRFHPLAVVPEGSTYFNPTDGVLLPGTRLVPDQQVKETYSDWTPMGNVAFDFTEDMMAYLTYSEGFKSGGFDQRYNQIFTQVSSFQPETIKSWEAGMKFSGLDNRVRVNVAAFTSNYDDLQIIIREGFAPVTFNGGKADIKGFEIEGTVIPNDRWMLQFAVGHIDAEYQELSPEVIAKSPIRESYSLAQTPKWSLSAGIAYILPVGKWGEMTVRGDWSYKSTVYNDAINTPQLKADDYHLLNVSVDFASYDELWEIVAAVRNITNQKYLISGSSAYDTGASYTTGIFDRGTEWRLAVKRSF